MSRRPIDIDRFRLIVLAILFTAPVAVLAGLGAWYLYETGWWRWAWWPMIAVLILAYVLAWRWQARRKLLQIDFDPPMTWTDQDREAWELVKRRAEELKDIPAEKLSDLTFYLETAKELTYEISRFYHPDTDDPIGPLTIPEILAVAELAAHDLGEMVRRYLPASHLLTVRDWRRAQKAVKVYQTASNIYWLVSAVFAPYQTVGRYLVTRLGIGQPLQFLKQNLLLWFYTAFVHRLGTYLIELNSGRLRVGATRYRELAKQAGIADLAGFADDQSSTETAVAAITLTLIGQTKAGKSSLINALLKEQRAATSVLPETKTVTEYHVAGPDGTALRVLDTAGYGVAGMEQRQFDDAMKAAMESDIILLVVHAMSPGRAADLGVLQRIREWFAQHPKLRQPPILAVLTHIDLLSPSMEWQPPYNWQQPTRPKEKSIEAAVEAVRGQLGEYLVGAVPVCTAPGKLYGVEEFLLPTIGTILEQGRAVAFLRIVHREADERKLQKVLEQVWEGGKALGKVLWKQITEPR